MLGMSADMTQSSAIGRTGQVAQRIAAIALIASAIAGCTADMGLNNVTFTPPNSETARNSAKPDWATFSGSKSEFTLRPVAEVGSGRA